MNFISLKKPSKTIDLLLVAFLLIFISNNNSCAQDDKSAIVLYTSNVEFTYHQPFRSTYKSNHPSYIEVPKLNQFINLLQNYVQYLKKLERLKGNPNIRISYAPDSVIEDNIQQTRIIKINDLGLTNLLQKVNNYLIEYGFVKKEDVIENSDIFYNIIEQDITKHSSFSKSAYFKNLSLSIPNNQPDINYELLGKDSVLTTRPSRHTNLIYKLPLDGNPEKSEIFTSNEAKIWFQKMNASHDGKYLAFTDGLTPFVMNISTKETKPLFPDNDKISLLEYEWSPTQNILAGMILDEKTFERYVFIYDPEKNIMLDVGGFSKIFASNYLYAMPIWSPRGNRIVFVSAKSIHLIDLLNNKAQANLINIEGEIGEFIWSEDANSFAFVEVKGQTRNQYHFDDYDFRGCVLHRYRFTKSSTSRVIEDYAQCIESRNTLKIISFTDKDQVMYLEGKLVAPDVPGAFWDLTKTFNAYLTPLPTEKINDKQSIKSDKIKPQHLPMQYLFVHRSLDSKNANIYDSGCGHSNLLYTEDFYSSWFIGLYRQGGIGYKGRVYSFRSSPYPFQCYNYAYFLDNPQGQARLMLKFFQDYNVRSTDSDEKTINLFMQVNFNGILSIWSITLENFFNYLINGDKPKETVKKENVSESIKTGTDIEIQTATETKPVFPKNSFSEANQGD